MLGKATEALGVTTTETTTSGHRSIVQDTTLQIMALHSKFENPSTNFSVSDDLYAFPPLEICFWTGLGCDKGFSLGECVASVKTTIHPSSNKSAEEFEFPSQWSNCLGYNLADLDMQGSGNQDDSSERQTKPYTTVTMSWEIDPSNEEPYRDVVGVFLGSDSAAEHINVPYSRIVQPSGGGSGDATFIETGMTIGKNIRTVISGDHETSYHVQTISTVNYVNPAMSSNTTKNDTSQSSRGYLHLTITQGAFSLTELSDVNPLDISTLLGNIGGFWEILLVTWGLCFIASGSDSPTQRGRDCTHPILKGKELLSKNRRSINQTVADDPEGGSGEEPYWITDGKGRTDFPGIRSTRVIPPVGGHEPPKRVASFFRRPTGHDYPMRPGSSFTRSVDTGEGSVDPNGSGVDNQIHVVT